MAARSLKLSSVGKTQVERALTSRIWSTEDLAGKAGLARPTATNFRAGKAVDRKNFVKFCEVLELDWEVASGQTIVPSETPIASPSPTSQPNDAHIEQVREHCKQKILNQHRQMRLLGGREIRVDQLYVDVWLLDRPEHKLYKSPESLQKTFDVKNDRLALGRRIGNRTQGFDVANANAKLLILGKPGAGKTTFLKHLAVDWCEGKFQPDSIAVLIELRRIQNKQWNLLDRIDKELGLGNWNQITVLKREIKDFGKKILELDNQIRALRKQIEYPKEQVKNFKEQVKNLLLIQEQQKRRDEELRQQLKEQVKNLLLIQEQQKSQVGELWQQLEALPLQNLLAKGKILVLMDGLDEVPTIQLRRNVQNQLRQVAEDYPKNRFILTCRTQIIESIPDEIFTPVEVADFSEKQVQQFVQNWFRANGNSDAEAAQQWKAFDDAVNQNPDLKELTTTPILLSLICLVLQDSGQIPMQRGWLYEKGIKLLLSRWNDDKQIEGWEVGSETYRQLSIEQKQALLTKIAARKFENPENFVLFQQEEIADQITRFLQLANSREGVAVLKAIEAQHGLLIERADELWSFSHLTFQEYFTFQWLTQLPPEQLAAKIAKKQWQELVKQTVKLQQPSKHIHISRLIKQAIDQSIANAPKLQEFLTWVLQKSESVLVNYKPITIRIFYLDSALALTAILARTRARACDLARASDIALSHARALDLDLALDRNLVCDLDFAADLDFALDLVLDLALTLALARDLVHTVTFDQAKAFDRARARTFNRALIGTSDPELVVKLQQFGAALPPSPRSIIGWEGFQRWWQVDGLRWIEQLRQVMIEHRSIGHDWQFTDVQTQQLQRYYESNKFLMELMEIEGAVSDSVRAEIEDNLLLPWEELQRRQS